MPYLLAVGFSLVSTAISLMVFLLVRILNIWPGRIDRKPAMLQGNAIGMKSAEESSAKKDAR